MDTALYKQKIELLSRLIEKKEINLEEALLLLKNDQEEEKLPIVYPSAPNPWGIFTGPSMGGTTFTTGFGTTTII